MYVVTVVFDVDQADADRFLVRVRRQAQDSLSREPACRRFDVCVDAARPERVLLYEIYDTRADFDAHLESAHFRDFSLDVTPMVRGKTVETWTLD